MIEDYITEEDLKKEYKSARNGLIGGIFCFIVGLILLPFIRFGISVLLPVLTCLLIGLILIIMMPIQMKRIKNDPEKAKKKLSRLRKYKKRAKKMAKMEQKQMSV